jgi:hypothetical protein
MMPDSASPAGHFAAWTFIGFHLWAAAVKAAGSTDVDTVRAAPVSAPEGLVPPEPCESLAPWRLPAGRYRLM